MLLAFHHMPLVLGFGALFAQYETKADRYATRLAGILLRKPIMVRSLHLRPVLFLDCLKSKHDAILFGGIGHLGVRCTADGF
jgi:hypothetical protein